MTGFSVKDKEMIEFGRFTVYQSLKEMIEEGNNLNIIKFNELTQDTIRNITNKVLLDIIEEVLSEDSDLKDWREGLE
jgi:hypothetical protein